MKVIVVPFVISGQGLSVRLSVRGVDRWCAVRAVGRRRARRPGPVPPEGASFGRRGAAIRRGTDTCPHSCRHAWPGFGVTGPGARFGVSAGRATGTPPHTHLRVDHHPSALDHGCSDPRRRGQGRGSGRAGSAACSAHCPARARPARPSTRRDRIRARDSLGCPIAANSRYTHDRSAHHPATTSPTPRSTHRHRPCRHCSRRPQGGRCASSAGRPPPGGVGACWSA